MKIDKRFPTRPSRLWRRPKAAFEVALGVLKPTVSPPTFVGVAVEPLVTTGLRCDVVLPLNLRRDDNFESTERGMRVGTRVRRPHAFREVPTRTPYESLLDAASSWCRKRRRSFSHQTRENRD